MPRGYALVFSDRLADTVEVVDDGLPSPPDVVRVAGTSASSRGSAPSVLLDELTRTRLVR